ncbi:MAG: hypothetical protein ACI4SG_04830 [Oligosphaeraceae bacterium]
MKSLPSLLLAGAVLFLLAAWLPAQSPALPQDGLLSPEESVAFIQGLEARGLHDECLRQAEVFLRRYPGHPYREQVEQRKIRSLLSLKKYPEVVEAIRAHLKDFPGSAVRQEFLQCLGRCLQETGDPAAALEVYQELLADKATASSPEEEELRYRLAVCLATVGRDQEARAELRKLASLTLDAGHLPRIYACQYLAILRQNDGDAAGALSMLQPLLLLQELPDSLRQNLLLTVGYLSFLPPVQDFAQARAAYGSFLSEYPQDERAQEVRRNLLSCTYALGEHQEFLRLLQEYQSHLPADAPRDWELLWLAAQSSMALERWEEALPRLQDLAQSDAVAPARRQQARALRIFCLDALQRHQEVAEEADAYAQLHPQAMDLEQILLRRGAALQELHREEEAIQLYQSLLPRLAAGAPGPYQQAGLSLMRLLEAQGDFAQAATLCLALAEKAPATASQGVQSGDSLREAALPLLLKIPADPRALPLVDQLLAKTTDADKVNRLLQLRYHFALEAKDLVQTEATIQRILPLCTPVQTPVWRQRNARILRLQKRYAETIQEYQGILAHRETPGEMRREILPDLVALLYFQKRGPEAVPYLEELFRLSPPAALSRVLLAHIAQERRAQKDYHNAQRAVSALLQDASCPPEERIPLLLQLSDLQFLGGQIPQCRATLQEMASRLGAQGAPLPMDLLALKAELALMDQQPDAALTYAKEAQERRDAALLPDSRPRAQWALAQALLSLQDYPGALTAATQGFILEKHPVYSPRCYLVAAMAKEAQGDAKTAAELRNALRQEYPESSDPTP